MTLSRIGPYPIEREVGRGGMGVVFLGRDPRLKRPVAIKVLPEGFAQDPDRLARFEREARLLASLTHPNIAGIYGLEEADGQRFLVLEYVEGETLAEHLARGPLSVEETLDVCRQIASALEAAHEAGIVHRDLKPGNVKLTPAGEVKVLDFGLAKGAVIEAGSSPDLSNSPTMTQATTGVGVILGTAAYMSPEQARGKLVDRRTDIWSFGCVLYECLTGVKAFEGETVSDMIALILKTEPDWSKLPVTTPEKLRTLLGRCLEKDAKRRLRDIGDARIEIEEIQSGRVSSASGQFRAASSSGADAPLAQRRTSAWPAIAAAAAVAGAVLGAIAWHQFAPPAGTQAYRFTINAPPGATIPPEPAANALSPDGRTLAFVATDSSGKTSLWIRPLGGYEARPLPNTREGELPFWSADSRQVGFFAEGKLKRIAVDGNTPEVICDAPGGRGGTWNRNGVIVFCPAAGGPLYQVRAAGGVPVAVTTLDTKLKETAHRWPNFLPDGEHFIYAALPARNGQFASYVGSIRSMKRVPLLSAMGAPIYAAPGYLIFSRGDALQAQRFDPGNLKLSGDPISVGDPPAQTFMSGSPRASVSRNGVLAWMSSGRLDTRMVWVDRTGREISTVDIPLDRWSAVIVSPDGRHAAMNQLSSTGNDDVWSVDLERQITNRLTFAKYKSTAGAWSADGRSVYLGSGEHGPRDIHRKAADGTGPEEVVLENDIPFKDATSCSPDGKWIAIQQTGGPDGWNIMIMPTAGGPPQPFLVTPFDELGGRISPDGKWLLYESNESGSNQTYVQSFPVPGHKQQVTKTGAFTATWSGAGSEIIVLRPDLTVVSIQADSGPELHIGAAKELFTQPLNWDSWDVAPGGQKFLVLRQAVQSTPGISIAVNWMAGLRGK